MRQFPLVLACAGLLAGCMGSPAPVAPGQKLQISTAPLTLVGVEEVTYGLRVRSATEVVWEESGLTSTQYGDGKSAITYIGPCDASADANPHSVELWIENIKAGGVDLVEPKDFVNPARAATPVIKADITCLENADVPVEFNLTVLRNAQQGFFDVAVNFEDVFCSAKVDCVDALLHHGQTRDATAVVAFACTSGESQQSVLHLSDLTLTCTDGENTTAQTLSASAAPGQQGAAGSGVFEWAVYQTDEQLTSNGKPLEKCAWNRAVGLDKAALAGQSCRLSGVATATTDGVAPPADSSAYPVVTFDVEVLTASGQLCGPNPLNGAGSGVKTEYVTSASTLLEEQPLTAQRACSSAPTTSPACTSPFIYLRDRSFMLGDEPYVPVSMNYIFDIRHTPEDDYYIAPHSAFCTTPAGCCNDAPSCLAAARDQLAQIKAMGVNSLRIVGLAVIPEDGNLVLDCAHQWPDWLDYCPKSARLVMSPPDPRGLALIEDAVALAKEQGFHAIFLAGHHDVDADGIYPKYATYLTELAAHFVNEPTIFAYDLANEPVYEFAKKEIEKVDANAIGRLWYDAVRAGSPRAMVTMGLAEMASVLRWDPGSIPLDFVSYHIYGVGGWSDAMRDYLTSFLAWMGREPYPVIVGETGLSVDDNGTTEQEQALFAQHTLSTAWACGAMGFQWWLYRDVHWGPPGEHFGVVRWDGTERPAADAFRAFAPVEPRPQCTAPAYAGSSPDGAFTTHGQLVREDGTPVGNGYIAGRRCGTGGWDWTLSKADGTWELRSTAPVDDLVLSAAGLSREFGTAACGLVEPGVTTLHPLAISMTTSTPSTCPQ